VGRFPQLVERHRTEIESFDTKQLHIYVVNLNPKTTIYSLQSCLHGTYGHPVECAWLM
jgi:hypothetical protein